MALWILSAMVALGAAWGQQAPEGELDLHFVQAAAEGDMYELTSSPMAQQSASSEAVRAFAQRMIVDHTVTAERLAGLAESLGVDLPDLPPAPYQVMIAQLTQLEGAEFDRAYVRQQVLAHQLAVGLFEAAAANARDEQVRAFAQETLPALQEHLRMAQELAQQLGQP